MNWFDLHKQFHEERKADPIFPREYIDKWMLSDLPKVVGSILSREEYQGDGPLLPVSWMDFGHLGFVFGKNQGLVPFVYSQSCPTLLSQPLIEEEPFLSLWVESVHSHITSYFFFFKNWPYEILFTNTVASSRYILATYFALGSLLSRWHVISPFLVISVLWSKRCAHFKEK